jgi:hypothetical protein
VINFRFHLVSIVAVFLALAIGVVMGYGVLGQPTVEGLQNRIDSVEANAEARRRENDDLREQLERLEAASAATDPFAVTDRLTDVPTLVLAVRGVDGAVVNQTVELATTAGGDAPGVLWLEEKWTLADAADVTALAQAVGTDATRKAAVRDAGLAALVDRLAAGRTLDDDLLRTLADAGFLTFENVGDGATTTLADLGGVGSRALLVVGSAGSVPARLVVAPFARASVDAGLPLTVGEAFVAADDGPGRGALVGDVRADDALAKEVSTVDDLDHPTGTAVAVLALADLGRDVVGHYGFGDDASAPAPAWWQP